MMEVRTFSSCKTGTCSGGPGDRVGRFLRAGEAPRAQESGRTVSGRSQKDRHRISASVSTRVNDRCHWHPRRRRLCLGVLPFEPPHKPRFLSVTATATHQSTHSIHGTPHALLTPKTIDHQPHVLALQPFFNDRCHCGRFHRTSRSSRRERSRWQTVRREAPRSRG